MSSQSTLTASEEAQLTQTIEMFEVITQSQPQDYQSLEILKEAYSKLGREQELLETSKRIAKAYNQMGQISSAILEYESILQLCPEDKEALAALQEIESQATGLSGEGSLPEIDAPASGNTKIHTKDKDKGKAKDPANADLGKDSLHKIFVGGKIISAADFDSCWQDPEWSSPPIKPVEPFIEELSRKNMVPIEKSLRVISDKVRLGFVPVEKYDVDIDLARSFPAESCLRWCILPFDRMSKSILVATANPFNRQAVEEMEEATKQRLLWYLSTPTDIILTLKKVFR